MNPKWQLYFIDVATRTSKLSHATRLQVGAVAVLDKRIICVGFNGTPAGTDNSCEELIDGQLVTKSNVVHAEDNLVKFAKGHNINIEGCDLYITHSPCRSCAQIIVDAGIKSVYYNTHYRNVDGIELLNKHNIYNEQIKGSI